MPVTAAFWQPCILYCLLFQQALSLGSQREEVKNSGYRNGWVPRELKWQGHWYSQKPKPWPWKIVDCPKTLCHHQDFSDPSHAWSSVRCWEEMLHHLLFYLWLSAFWHAVGVIMQKKISVVMQYVVFTMHKQLQLWFPYAW